MRKNYSKTGAFTLIEILVVTTIILVLVGLTLNVATGIRAKAARTKAQGELAILAQALNEYKAHHGDYPWVDSHPGSDTDAEESGKLLYRSLIGNRSPMGNNVLRGGNLVSKTDKLQGKKGKSFVELDKLTMQEDPSPDMPTSLDTKTDNYFVDPWGKPYYYAYKTVSDSGKAWESFGFVLYSFGPDGAEQDTTNDAPDSDGIIDQDFRDKDTVVDNIFIQ